MLAFGGICHDLAPHTNNTKRLVCNGIHLPESLTFTLLIWHLSIICWYYQRLLQPGHAFNPPWYLLSNNLPTHQFLFHLSTRDNSRTPPWQPSLRHPIKRLHQVMWYHSQDGISLWIRIFGIRNLGDCPRLVVEILDLSPELCNKAGHYVLVHAA